MGIRFTIILCFLMVFSSCSNRSITNDDIDKFISKYNNETFSDFINVSISYRDTDWGNNIYIVGKQGGNVPPYVVYFNKRKNDVTKIETNLLQQSNCKDYFSEAELKRLMKKFINFNIQNLSVDSNGNAFISPFFGEHSPILLRLKKTTNEREVKKGYIYELYKDNWYLKK